MRALRSLPSARTACVSKRRHFTTTRVQFAETDASLGSLPQKKPIGGIRGGIIGFLFGFSLAASFAAYNLLDEYKQASAALQASVEELRVSTEKMSGHVKRIEQVEHDMKALVKTSATKDETSRVRTEMKQLFDSLHIEFLDLRTHVWGMQQDLHELVKNSTASVRI